MKHRRRSCVRSEEKDSKHFMKAILPSPIHSKQIRIPDEFITRFGNELTNVAKITVPDGRQWDIELKKCGNHVFLCNKWQQFAEYYSITYGCYLDFKYEGNSEFNLVIYDTTSVEISYPSKTPKRPSFRSKYIKATRGEYVYVPFEFAAKYLKLKVPFKLQNPQGKQWQVSCILNNKGSSSMRIVKGLPGFARENNLLKRHIYEFQLIKMKPVVVLLVTLSHTHRQQNCRPSSAEEEVREPNHFKKAILPSPIHAKQIKIPDNFITLFGNELNNVAKVTVPDGRVWDIDLKKCGENVFFCNNWQQFAEFYSIEYGCYLSFKYEGKSMFSVIIFDATSVEIVYPLRTPSNDGELYTKCPSPRKRSMVETSKSQGKKLKSMSKHASKRAEVAAIEFKPSYPYFRSKIASEDMWYLKQNGPIKIQNAHGEEWEVFCIPNTFGSSEMRIVRGFPNFQRANNLSHGDYCVFELIKKKPVVLKVTMFRTVDYGD